MEQGAEDVPVVYLHEIKRQYMQGEMTLTILNGAKLALWAGQSVALVAPSGAGKSTLLHIAGLLESPDDGEVYIGGAPTSGLSDVERTQIRRTDIGFVYQSHRLLPEFSALENVMLPQMIRGLKRAETVKRATEILAYLGLGDRIKHRPAELSGGEQQRVAIARAVANAPRVAAGGRTDRKSRSAHRRPRVSSADATGQGDPGGDADRDPQHGACRPHGPAGVAGGRPGRRTRLIQALVGAAVLPVGLSTGAFAPAKYGLTTHCAARPDADALRAARRVKSGAAARFSKTDRRTVRDGGRDRRADRARRGYSRDFSMQ